MSPETIDAMLVAGASAEVIAAAWKAEIAAQQKALEEKRAKDAERQRRHRQSRDVTVTERDERDPSPFEVSPQTPLPKTPNQCAPLNPPKSRAKKAVSIQAPEWMPVEPWLAFVAMRERMAREGRPRVLWSEDAAKGVIGKITRLRSEGHCPAKLLEKAVVSSWRTVFEDDDTKATPEKRVNTLTAQEWRERAEWYIRHGQPDNAEECRRRAIALETREAA